MNRNNFLSTRNESKPINKNDFRLVALDEEQQNFTKLVFASSPETGNPMSAIAYMMSSQDEGFKNYVRENLLSAVNDGSIADSSDEAMELVKGNLVTPESYLDFMQSYIREKLINQNDE